MLEKKKKNSRLTYCKVFVPFKNKPQMDLKAIIEDAKKTSVPTLMKLCVIKCTIELYKQKEIRDILKSVEYSYFIGRKLMIKSRKEWKMINEIIVDKLNSLVIPKVLKDKMLANSFSIALEMLKWINEHQNIEIPDEFCWTVKGTIDHKNTAKMIIKNESICIKERYKMSCNYCLDTEIILLWINMSFKDKNYFIDSSICNPIVFYWVITMCAPKDKVTRFSREHVFEEALQFAVENGYLDAVKHLLFKVDNTVRQTYLDDIFEYIVEESDREADFRILEVNEADTWFFLFANMTEELQLKYFMSYDSFEVVLQMFFHSCRQKYLIMLMQLASENLDRYHYNDICCSLVSKYLLGYKDCNYRKIFIQIWRQIPKSKQKFVQRKALYFLIYLMKIHFSFLLEKGTLKSKGERITKYLKSNKLISHLHIDRCNWKFLLFLIKARVVPWHVIKLNKGRFLSALDIREGKELAWRKTSLLMRRILANKKLEIP